ncbi:unnamed protein product [Staurois parvus]|uniref:RNA-binding protein NOB1 n=1 Tax=Staurois parvus TaxID=386267 RepID=A0ABN9BDT3_9NEOB|nr:unnamed protein product [Staurois parvus]
MAAPRVQHVVADSGAFLRNAALQEIGAHVYTVREVVTEIRDKATRRRLAVLPYELIFKEPKPESVQLVTEFSKKTGDYGSLSAIDIKVLALAYQLEAEHVGEDHIRTEPTSKVSVSSTARHPEAPVNVAGFHFPSKPAGKKDGSVKSTVVEEKDEESKEFNSFLFWRSPLPSIEDDLVELMVRPEPATSQDNTLAGSSGDEEEDHDDDDDGGGWITPGNLKQIQQDMGVREAPDNVFVGCLTTDFAMQNVLIQMGLHVLSVDGMLIRQTRNYVLRCHGCFK